MAEYNAADRKQIRAAEKASAIAERQHGEVVVEMMATPQRRRFIWDKLSAANIFATTFSTDPLQMAFNEGQRNQGLVLLTDIMQYCPEQFTLAMQEHNVRHESSNASSRAGTGQRAESEGRDGDSEGRAGDDIDAPGGYGEEAGSDAHH